MQIGTEPDLVLFFDCPEEEMVKRVLSRNQGRVDDNIETVKERLKVFRALNLPVIKHYSEKGKLYKFMMEKMKYLYCTQLLIDPRSHRRLLTALNKNTCRENYEPFVSYEGLEQLHRFIFVMAVTHISYSCLTMLLAIVKIHSWRKWENEAHMDSHNSLPEITRALTMRRQSTFVRVHTSNFMDRNSFLVWVTCFFRQFGCSVVSADYLTLRQGFITNHNLTSKYDFHSYMIRSMEEEFQRIVGVSAPLWGFVVAFMLFNVKECGCVCSAV